MSETAAHWSEPVRARPAAVAAVGAAVPALLAWRIGWRPELAAFALLGVVGTVLAFVDGGTRRLPEPLTLPLAPALLLLLWLARGEPGRSLAGALLGMAVLAGCYGLLWWVSPNRGIGFGDVVLSVSLGLALGWLGSAALITGVLASHLLGAVWALVLVAAGRAGRGTEIPFGPFLLAGTLLAVLLRALPGVPPRPPGHLSRWTQGPYRHRKVEELPPCCAG